MVRAMHERAVGGVNGLLARGWKESTSMGHAEGGGQLEGAVDGCRGYRWRWSSDESSLWVVLGMVRLSQVSALQVAKGARCRSGTRARRRLAMACRTGRIARECRCAACCKKLQEVQSNEVSV